MQEHLNIEWPQMLWICRCTSKLESSWIAVQRFMYVNDLSGPDYAALMASGSSRKPRSKTLDQKHLWGHSVDFALNAIRAFRRDLKSRSEMSDFPNFKHLANSNRPIRYCTECLAHCFHWPFFQVPAVTRCPYHNIGLVTGCIHCGKTIGTDCFIPRQLDRPLECPSCHRPFTDAQLGFYATAGYPEAEETFVKATAQLTNLLHAKVVNMDHHLEFNFRSDAVAKLYFNCLFKTAQPCEKHPSWLFGMDVSTSGPKRRGSSMSQGSPSGVMFETIEEKLTEIIRIYKSVGRHLSTRVRAICGHRQVSDLDFSYEYVPFSGSEYYLLMQNDSCPCCAVLDWWRARLALQFGVLAYLNGPTSSPGPHLVRNFKDWPDGLYPMNVDEAAFVAISIFSCLSIRMLGILGGEQADAVLLRELYEGFIVRDCPTVRTSDARLQLQNYGEDLLRLHIPRHHVSRESIRTELGSNIQDFCFSTSSAFIALQACHKIRRAGPLWSIRGPNLSGGRVVRDTPRPKWYEDMARHSNTRFWYSRMVDAFRQSQVEAHHAR